MIDFIPYPSLSSSFFLSLECLSDKVSDNCNGDIYFVV